eukprot:scaffold4.g4995.t1
MFWKKETPSKAEEAPSSGKEPETKPCSSGKGKAKAAEGGDKADAAAQPSKQQQQQPAAAAAAAVAEQDKELEFSTFEFGGPLKSGATGMTGVCQSVDPNVVAACVWSPAPAREGQQKQRFSVFF